MQLMQTSWVSPAQACGSPRVALDQRRVLRFSRAMRAITARVGPCAWAGLQAMVATSHFRQRLLKASAVTHRIASPKPAGGVTCDDGCGGVTCGFEPGWKTLTGA